MYEQRLTSRLISYWEKLKGTAEMPLYAQLNPGALDDIWDNCMVLKIEPSPAEKKNYVYTHCGSKIIEAIGQDITGQRMSANMKFFPGAKIIKRIDEVSNLSTPTPLLDDGQFVNEKSKVIKYRACLLVFGAEKHVTHVIVGVSWRAF